MRRLSRRFLLEYSPFVVGSLALPRAIHHPLRYLRTRGCVDTAEGALRHAEEDEPAASVARPPPNAMDLAYMCSKIPAVQAYQTEPSVWEASTVREAWKRLYAALMAAHSVEEPVAAETRRATLKERDLVGLAHCTNLASVLHLMSLMPSGMRADITDHDQFSFDEVEEFFIHIGQDIEVRGSDWVTTLPPPSLADLQHIVRCVGKFGVDGRGCITHTAHRVSAWKSRQGEILGVTVRVGRFVPNAARALLSLAHRGSLLIISRAGVGKTTLLRDLAASIAQEPGRPRINVVDTSNEIGGDNPTPMPFLGRCRRIQVPRREDQSRIMTEVIQNHSPEYLVVDEVSSAAEAEAAWSISQRGVHLIATCHGKSLVGLLQNQSLNLLVGGAAQAFLSNEERRLRNKTKKTVLERPHASPFMFVVELISRTKGYLYVDVNRAVDLILDGQNAKADAAVGGSIDLAQPLPDRLERLVARQERYAQDESESFVQEVEGELVEGLSERTDNDGYTIRETPHRREKRSALDDRQSTSWTGNRGGNIRKPPLTDDQILKELSHLL